MSGKKGMKKYPVGVRETVVTRIREGESQRVISQEYGISRYAIQSWLKEPSQPKHRSGSAHASPLRLKLNISYSRAFWFCPYNLDMHIKKYHIIIF